MNKASLRRRFRARSSFFVRTVLRLIAISIALDARAGDEASCRVVTGEGSPVLFAPDVRTLARGDLTLHADVPADTGTMHFASDATVAADGLPAVSLGPEIPQAQLKLDATHYLVLGWSSRGGGMQSQSAFLLRRARHSLAITDELVFESSREEGRLLLRVTPLHESIGVVATAGAPVGEAWSLRVGLREYDLPRLRRTAARPIVGGPCDFVSYHPPFGESGAAALSDNRALWFDVRGDRFVLSGRRR